MNKDVTDQLSPSEWMMFFTAIFRGGMGLFLYGASLLYLPQGYWTPIMSGTGFLFGAQAFAELLTKYRRRSQLKIWVRGIIWFLALGALAITILVFAIPPQNILSQTEKSIPTEHQPMTGIEVGIVK